MTSHAIKPKDTRTLAASGLRRRDVLSSGYCCPSQLACVAGEGARGYRVFRSALRTHSRPLPMRFPPERRTGFRPRTESRRQKTRGYLAFLAPIFRTSERRDDENRRRDPPPRDIEQLRRREPRSSAEVGRSVECIRIDVGVELEEATSPSTAAGMLDGTPTRRWSTEGGRGASSRAAPICRRGRHPRCHRAAVVC